MRTVDATKLRRLKAQTTVLAKLERRWQSEIPGGVLLPSLRKRIRQTDAFNAHVETYLDGNFLVLPDLNVTGRHVTVNGLNVDLLVKELGVDPAEYHCRDCVELIPKGQGLCSDCAEWAREQGAVI